MKSSCELWPLGIFGSLSGVPTSSGRLPSGVAGGDNMPTGTTGDGEAGKPPPGTCDSSNARMSAKRLISGAMVTVDIMSISPCRR